MTLRTKELLDAAEMGKLRPWWEGPAIPPDPERVPGRADCAGPQESCRGLADRH